MSIERSNEVARAIRQHFTEMPAEMRVALYQYLEASDQELVDIFLNIARIYTFAAKSIELGLDYSSVNSDTYKTPEWFNLATARRTIEGVVFLNSDGTRSNTFNRENVVNIIEKSEYINTQIENLESFINDDLF